MFIDTKATNSILYIKYELTNFKSIAIKALDKKPIVIIYREALPLAGLYSISTSPSSSLL
jgi:hypothetical protein